MAESEFDQVIEQQHVAVAEFARGNDEPLAKLWSRRDDVTLGNPFGPFVRGFEQVAETMQRAATYYQDGGATGFEQLAKHVTADLAYIVEVERFNAKIGGREAPSTASNSSGSMVREHSCKATITKPPSDS